jgi:hypothetical protein
LAHLPVSGTVPVPVVIFLKVTVPVFCIISFITEVMSAVADPQAAKSIQTNLKELMKSLRRYDEIRKSSLSSLESINSSHRVAEGEEKLTPAGQIKLLKQYQEVPVQYRNMFS